MNKNQLFKPQIEDFKQLLIKSSPYLKIGHSKLLNFSQVSGNLFCKLSVAYLEYVSQDHHEKKGFQILHALCNHENGASNDELISFLYPKTIPVSDSFKYCLLKRLEKHIQRARALIKPYRIELIYDKEKKIYKLQPKADRY